MKRSSSGGVGRSRHQLFGDDDTSDEDDEWSFAQDSGPGSNKRRKSTANKSWTKFFQDKRQDFTPSQSESRATTPPVPSVTPTLPAPLVTPTATSSEWMIKLRKPYHHIQNSDNVFEIDEFESPKKRERHRLEATRLFPVTPVCLTQSESRAYTPHAPSVTATPTRALTSSEWMIHLHHHNQNSNNILEIGEFESPKKGKRNMKTTRLLPVTHMGFAQSQSKDYTPPVPSVISTPTRTSEWMIHLDHHNQNGDNVFEIDEFESPKKSEGNILTTTRLFPVTPMGFTQSQPRSPIPVSPLRSVPVLSSSTILNKWYNMREQQKENSDDIFEIGEFESPKKDSLAQYNVVPYSEQWTVVGGRRRKKRCLGDELKSIVHQYDSSVRRFAQDYRLNKFDENKSMTLVIRHICGEGGDITKLFWTICRDVEVDEDRCVMFKPPNNYEIAIGVVLKLYQPWKEISVPGVPMPVIICSDFYRIGGKRDNYFEVSEEVIQELKSFPVPSKSNCIKVVVDNDLKSLFSNLIPFALSNTYTIAKQTKLLSKPSIDLKAVIHKLSTSSLVLNSKSKFGENLILLCDSDNLFSVLQLPEFGTNAEKQVQLLQVLESGRYLKFQKLGIISKTTILQEKQLFSILQLNESNQKVYYTLGIRYDTVWEMETVQMDFPYRPITIPLQLQFTHEFNDVHSRTS